MNLWFRLFWLLVTGLWRQPLVPPFGVSRLEMRVLPTDLDTNGHMNNGRYFTLMDLGRMDLILRSGLWRPVWKHRWMPVLSAAKMRFRRELRLFRRFALESRLVWWDETRFVMEQRFIAKNRDGEEMVMALALLLGGLYDRKARRFVPVADLLHIMGTDTPSPEPTEAIRAFLDAEDALKNDAAGSVQPTGLVIS